MTFSLTACRVLTHDEKALIAKNLDVLKQYKANLDGIFSHEDFAEQDFFSLALGFFIGKGLVIKDAFTLTQLCQYVLDGFS